MNNMKRIVFLTILIFITGIMSSCNNSSSSDDVTIGYVDPALETAKDINAYKAYTLNTIGTCSASESCLAIIYQGTISEISYVGIAVQNGTEKLKIYWQATSIPVGTNLSIPDCTVSYNGTVTTNVTIKVNITDNNTENAANGTYNIVFKDTVTGTDIVDTNFIDAVKI